MKLNDLRTIMRISGKIIISWIFIIFIFFLHPLNVNLSEQPNRPFQTDKIIQASGLKKYNTGEIDKSSILDNTKNKTLKRKITNGVKYRFLLTILKQAFSKTHSASLNRNSFDKLCSYYKTYCKIIDISNTDFNYQERLYYVGITIYLLHFVNTIFPDLTDKLYYIKIQKSKNGRRGYAGHHSIVTNVKKNMTYKDFYEVLSHEFGHIVDLGLLNGNSSIKSSIFKEFGRENFVIDDPSLKFYSLTFLSSKVKKPSIYSKDFVSGYAMTNVFEDFAETFNMYVNHNYVFRKMAKESNILQEKYNFLNKILKGKYLLSDKIFYYKYGYRPWDTTMIKYNY